MTTTVLQAPLCARCGHTVEQASAMEADDGDGILLRFRCHGEVEEHRLARADLDDAAAMAIAEVFRNPEDT